MNRKEKIGVSALALSLLCVSLLAVGLYVNQGQLYERYLSEHSGLDSEVKTVSGHLTVLVLREGETDWQLAWSEHNVITNAGKNQIRDQIGGTAGAAFDYIAIGTGSGGGVSSTALVTEFTRQQGTYAEPVDYNWTITYTFGAGTFSGTTITEAGCLNAAASGTLLNYQDFTGITLQSGDSLQVQFEFMVS